MYRKTNFGKNLLSMAAITFAVLVGGVVGYFSHTPATPTNNVPPQYAYLSLAFKSCMNTIDSR